METVAFYSYKGGVGRSLLLADAARFLVTRGKGVVALDLDFEAPGLHYKLGGPGLLLQPIEPTTEALNKGHELALYFGAVPYLIATAEGTAFPPSLDEHMTSVLGSEGSHGWLGLMPAGPAPHPTYWAALKELNAKLRLGDPSGRGFMALLDLQARIAEKLNPDYLLIDARTGVTELGSLATTVLADTVVCMFAANQESLDGTLEVVRALKAAPRLADQRPIRVVLVLSRATRGVPEDDHFEGCIEMLIELSDHKKLFPLPHDDLLGTTERLMGAERRARSSSPLDKARLDLLESLFPADAERAGNVRDRL